MNDLTRKFISWSQSLNEEVVCPICGRENYELGHQKTFSQTVQSQEFTWMMKVAICQDCGMIFVNPQPSDETLEVWYGGYSKVEEVSPRFSRAQLDFLEAVIPEGFCSLFDVGAYDGTFVVEARSRGYKAGGLEASAQAVAMARQRYGLNLEHGYFGADYLAEKGETYDLVSVRHVLEHTKDPVGFLTQATSLTDRYLFVEVPDIERAFFDNLSDIFFSLEHLLYFTRGSLTNSAARAGMKVVAFDQPPTVKGELPVIRCLLRKEGSPCGVEDVVNFSEESRAILSAYRQKRETLTQAIRRKIPTGEVVIYGAGMHTAYLLQSGVLEGIRVVSIVDSNPSLHGETMAGVKILPPGSLTDSTATVLISSYAAQEEICRSLRECYPQVNAIRLYDEVLDYLYP